MAHQGMAMTEKSFSGAALFGMKTPTKRSNVRLEVAALVEALKAHPAVSTLACIDSGAVRIGSRFIHFGWPGCPDGLGQLMDGRWLGVEVKVPTGRSRQEKSRPSGSHHLRRWPGLYGARSS
jgi:hypothetical protein